VVEQRTAIIAAVRITDTFLPLALAVPVFLFARAFARPGARPGGSLVAVVLVGLVAVASGNALLMAGGMIKNAVALPGSFLFASAAYRWLRGGGRAPWGGRHFGSCSRRLRT
jgi:lipopolysaccharide export LptBFGC system permease protein LptF